MNNARMDLAPDFGRRWAGALLGTFLDRTDELGDLDRRSGDGDFGTNIASALRRAQQNIDAEPPQDYAGWLTAISRGFLGTGGTSGPLFGMFFRELSRCASGAEPTLAEFADGLAAGLATVQRYGGAEVGHKTMVDAIAPAVHLLESRRDGSSAAADVLAGAAQAAVAGARSTADLLAKRGRASYVGEVARGVIDPGAAAAAIVLQAAAAAEAGDQVDTSWLRG